MIYPGASWRSGPSWKINRDPNGLPTLLYPRGIVLHSMVGYKMGAYSVLDGAIRASWHFSVYQDGSVEQHYDTTVQCWHAQGANSFCVGIEHEGGYNPETEPLTEVQLASSLALCQWLGKQYKFELVRWGEGKTLWEHNEFWPKQCPSGRIPWHVYDRSVDMDEQEVIDLIDNHFERTVVPRIAETQRQLREEIAALRQLLETRLPVAPNANPVFITDNQFTTYGPNGERIVINNPFGGGS